MAAVENLAQLLCSRRVGPRQLALAVPDVRAGCTPLASAIAELETALMSELADDPEGQAAVTRLLGYAASRVTALGKALEGRELTPIVARERLSLEAIVQPIADELDAVVRLVDLLGTASASRSTVIDLRDVIAERRSSPRRRMAPVRTAIEFRAPVLVGDARVVFELLELAALAVFRAGVLTPRILAEASEDELTSILVGADPLEGAPGDGQSRRIIEIQRRAELPSDIDVARAAARRAGIDFQVTPDERSVSIGF